MHNNANIQRLKKIFRLNMYFDDNKYFKWYYSFSFLDVLNYYLMNNKYAYKRHLLTILLRWLHYNLFWCKYLTENIVVYYTLHSLKQLCVPGYYCLYIWKSSSLLFQIIKWCFKLPEGIGAVVKKMFY